MKHLTILVPEGENNISSIAGSYKIFTRANLYWKERTGREMFTIELAGLSGEVDFHNGLFAVKPHTHMGSIERTDLVIIPSLNHNFESAIKSNGPMIDWIVQQYKQGAEVASICTGAFLLASSGLLDGRLCSTHWAAAERFRQMFPDVILKPDKLITDEHGIYTNGGAYSFLNLVIYLVEKYFDRATAILCSKVFQVEADRQSQSPFAIFTGQKSHGDDLVREAQSYIESQLHDKISVDALSQKFSIGRRTFDRRFIKATGNSPIEYSQRVKIEAAKKSLETSRKTIQEVMYDVGYSDLKAFREVFRRITGVSPLEYRRKHGLGLKG